MLLYIHVSMYPYKTVETSKIEAPLLSKLHQKGHSPNGPEYMSGPTFSCC